MLITGDVSKTNVHQKKRYVLEGVGQYNRPYVNVVENLEAFD